MADTKFSEFNGGVAATTFAAADSIAGLQGGGNILFPMSLIRPYKSYTARLSQLSTAAPTVVYATNELGATITWTRATTGVFIATADSAVFTAGGKTVVLQSVSGSGGYADPKISTHQVDSTTVITFGVFSDFSTLSNNFLMDVEIRVYF